MTQAGNELVRCADDAAVCCRSGRAKIFLFHRCALQIGQKFSRWEAAISTVFIRDE
jgi:hypothetical protein